VCALHAVGSLVKRELFWSVADGGPACASGGPHHAVSPDVARRSCVGPLHL